MGSEQRQSGSASVDQSPEEALTRASNHMARSSGHFVNGILEANRALMAPFHESDEEETEEHESVTEEWSFERTVEKRENLAVGDSVRFTKPLSEEDVQSFARVSGDTNPLHLDDEFAEQTRFGGRIVHGSLMSSLISAALARLPGLTVYLSQSHDFLAPGEIGGRMTAVCEIVEDLGDDRYRLETIVHDEDGETLIDGEAVVLIDEAPEDEA